MFSKAVPRSWLVSILPEARLGGLSPSTTAPAFCSLQVTAFPRDFPVHFHLSPFVSLPLLTFFYTGFHQTSVTQSKGFAMVVVSIVTILGSTYPLSCSQLNTGTRSWCFDPYCITIYFLPIAT